MSTQGNPSTQLRKVTVIETTTPLVANASYVGGWHDSDADGSVYAIVQSLSNVAATAGTFSVQLSDDINNAGLTYNADAGAISPGAATRITYPVYLRSRYWRILYQNGAAAQTTFEITYTLFSGWMGTIPGIGASPSAVGSLAVLAVLNAGAIASDQGAPDNSLSGSALFSAMSGSGGPIAIHPTSLGGTFSGTADLVRQGWSRQRTPTVFKRVTTAALGSTSIWLPGIGNKFRLLRYRITVGASAIMAATTDLTIALLDNVLDIGQDYIVRIPAAALASGVNYDTGWVDLGTFGILSAAINQTLNVNLSAALTGGLISVIVAGTEE